MMKQLITALLAIILLIPAVGTAGASDHNTDEGIDERFGLPILVLGGNLDDNQKQEVREMLGVTDPESVEEVVVTGEDLVRYIEGEDSRARMFSSAKITRQDEGHGLVIERVNPENITQVTDTMYANALLTAGIENATVEIASPVKVSGHSALTGIYKAYEVSGEELDTARLEVANDELNLATDLAEEEGIDQEKVSELLAEIKQAIAEQNPATREDVEQIINEQLSNLEINLSEEDRQRLTDLFEQMRNLNINFDNVSEQLNDLSTAIQDRLSDVVNDEGFWQGVRDFFQGLIDAISGLFGGSEEEPINESQQ
ncbi:DUF1002 domain-containing protein [Jeotgalibacillus haloalkalitolerans]|uniref:DUF1002 domain-containing protein n=1 Tax=Jeotgalibacillus haloalkalitolerans TaxID=3104292 RepID=A0ABU5KPR9_9BACL|nr:DUF1002 domain-containing protein [Jeotgalibacillus sp. HH7-29]MDZ5713242.1 DUF1002 domain-containing protein [Jeotgalibacillus sp. HH7-29]